MNWSILTILKYLVRNVLIHVLRKINAFKGLRRTCVYQQMVYGWLAKCVCFSPADNAVTHTGRANTSIAERLDMCTLWLGVWQVALVVWRIRHVRTVNYSKFQCLKDGVKCHANFTSTVRTFHPQKISRRRSSLILDIVLTLPATTAEHVH